MTEGNKLLQNRLLDLESEEYFACQIEVDEIYFGGVQKGKRGRGAKGKVAVFGILKRCGKVYTKVILKCRKFDAGQSNKKQVVRNLMVSKYKYSHLVYQYTVVQRERNVQCPYSSGDLVMTAILDLNGKKGLIVGIANEHSIAYGCARVFRNAGADLAITYAKAKSEPYVRPLAEHLGATIILPCDVLDELEMNVLFDTLLKEWGKLDFLLHSIAFAPKADLQGRVTDCSKEGFLMAMDISCHSFIRMAKLAEPLMSNGGSLLTVTYVGSEQVVNHYGLMGPVKAALESTVKYLAVELGDKNIRINALSPSAIATHAGSGIAHFDEMLEQTKENASLHRMVDLNDIGNMAAFLVSDLAKNITGGIHMIDG